MLITSLIYLFAGTKYESVLVKAPNDEAFKALGRANLTGLTQGFRMAADAVVRNLDCQARKITTFEEIAQVHVLPLDFCLVLGSITCCGAAPILSKLIIFTQ